MICSVSSRFCGAYYFGTWSRQFTGHHIKNPTETHYDVDQTSSQDAFGNPYAFFGIPGIGTGMGVESIQYSTSQYLRNGLMPNAEIRYNVETDEDHVRRFDVVPSSRSC